MKELYQTNDLSQYNNYQLCYVDEIPETYSDYDEKSKALMKTEEYKEYMRKRREALNKLMDEREKNEGYRYLTDADYTHYDHIHDPNFKFETEFKDYPHPDFKAGYTHFLYFTNNMSKQWGDDWDDAPYEYNAGPPYDSETDVIVIPFNLRLECDIAYINFPSDYHYNSRFSVDMINAGAIPWIFAYFPSYKGMPEAIRLMGGDTLFDVINKFNSFLTVYGDKLEKLLFDVTNKFNPFLDVHGNKRENNEET